MVRVIRKIKLNDEVEKVVGSSKEQPVKNLQLANPE